MNTQQTRNSGESMHTGLLNLPLDGFECGMNRLFVAKP